MGDRFSSGFGATRFERIASTPHLLAAVIACTALAQDWANASFAFEQHCDNEEHAVFRE
jgi:hypothetical protein